VYGSRRRAFAFDIKVGQDDIAGQAIPGTKSPRTGNHQDPILPAPDHATGPPEREARNESDLVDGRVHGVGADGALEQLVHPGGRRDKRPRPRTPAAVGGDDRAGVGGRLEERARELRRRGGVVVLLHAVGVGHALDAVELHGPHQIEPNLPPGPGEREPPRRRRSSSKAGRGAAPDGEGNREGEGKGREGNGGCGGGW
jgi:hypothetical protein